MSNRANVNFPLAATNAGRIAFSLLGANTLLDLELSALQQEGRGEVVSNPRVITANRQEAVIEQGTEIPYQQAASSGATNVSFKKAVLSLRATPQITPDDRIILDLKVTKDSVGQIYAGVPSIDTKQVETQVLMNNGETVVLGGVYERNNATASPCWATCPSSVYCSAPHSSKIPKRNCSSLSHRRLSKRSFQPGKTSSSDCKQPTARAAQRCVAFFVFLSPPVIHQHR